MSSEMVWYVMRSTGAVLLVLFTISVVLGVFSTRGNAGGRIPRFVTQDFHRNISLLSMVMLVAHIVTAVVHTFVNIRWFDALVPGIAVYQPLWIGLGALAVDLSAVVVVTSLLRHRLSERSWRWVHYSTYAAWVSALIHGFGIGTDARSGWMLWVEVLCMVAFASAVTVRLASRRLVVDPAEERWGVEAS